MLQGVCHFSTMVQPTFTMKVPRGKERIQPLSFRERKKRAKQPTGAKTRENSYRPRHSLGLHSAILSLFCGNNITRRMAAIQHKHVTTTVKGSRTFRSNCSFLTTTPLYYQLLPVYMSRACFACYMYLCISSRCFQICPDSATSYAARVSGQEAARDDELWET